MTIIAVQITFTEEVSELFISIYKVYKIQYNCGLGRLSQAKSHGKFFPKVEFFFVGNLLWPIHISNDSLKLASLKKIGTCISIKLKSS